MKIIYINRKNMGYTILTLFILLLLIGVLIYFKDKSHNTFTDPGNGVVVIDAGHGGIDGGARSGDLLEKEVNLSIAITLKSILEDKGYLVILTRDTDTSLDKLSSLKASRHQKDLNARSSIINNANAQLFLSIHVNCHSKNPEANGAIVFYDDKYAQNEKLAYSIQRALNKLVIDGEKRTTHDPQKANYYLLSHAKVPGVIIETAFLSNKIDRNLLLKEEFRELIAKSIEEGTEGYLKDIDLNRSQEAAS